MNSRFILVCIGVLLLVPVKATSEDNPQKEAETLLARARQLSDIRASNAPAFRLKATISFVGEDLDTFEGTFTELWFSDSRWRREIIAGEFRRIEVGGVSRIWMLDSDKGLPQQATRVPSVVNVFPARSAKFEFESVAGISPQDTTTKCAVTKPEGPKKAKHAFCFDTKSGVLVENVTPQFVRERLADYSCQYDTFKKFGEYWFPRDMNCVLNGHRQLEVKIVELSSEMPNDTALFTPPDGALEIGKCSSGVVPPKAVATPDPTFPQGNRDSSTFVSLIVDVHGKPQAVKVTKSGGKLFDEEAVRTVQRWRFKPASCNGDLMPMQIAVEVIFRAYR